MANGSPSRTAACVPLGTTGGAGPHFTSDEEDTMRGGLAIRAATSKCYCSGATIQAENSNSYAVVVESSENRAAVMLWEIGP